MRWGGRDKRAAQELERSVWHVWFAWHPVTTICQTGVWFEMVERKVWGVAAGRQCWEYRLVKGAQE